MQTHRSEDLQKIYLAICLQPPEQKQRCSNLLLQVTLFPMPSSPLPAQFRPQVEMSVLSFGAEPVTCQADLLLIRHRLPRDKSGRSSPGFTFLCTQDRFALALPSLSKPPRLVVVSIKVLPERSPGQPRPSYSSLPHPVPTSDLPQCCVVHRAQQGTLRLQCVVGWGVCQWRSTSGKGSVAETCLPAEF